jgi:hypothetical protein
MVEQTESDNVRMVTKKFNCRKTHERRNSRRDDEGEKDRLHRHVGSEQQINIRLMFFSRIKHDGSNKSTSLLFLDFGFRWQK